MLLCVFGGFNEYDVARETFRGYYAVYFCVTGGNFAGNTIYFLYKLCVDRAG